jgi:phenylacetate-coenzyme A ligase PaaK-like adenylate-forming protein
VTTESEELRQSFQAALRDRVPVHVERMAWDRARIAHHQRERLRQLLGVAIRCSPFHRKRLAGVDPERFEPSELGSLPVMTKAEMMASFDEVVTDRRLTRERIEAHLAATGEHPRRLEGRYLAIASGGSSGSKGAYVYEERALADFVARGLVLGAPLHPGLKTCASIVAPCATHIGRLSMALVDGGAFRVIPVAATLPLAQIVEHLNASRPDVLFGYPSLLLYLAQEQRAGRLAIRPARVTAGAEQMRPEVEAEITAAFGVPVVDRYAISEGLVGGRVPGAAGFSLASDLAIAELVDEENRPVPPGRPSARVLVTNLFNTVQPLIRYVLEDRLTRLADDPGHGHPVVAVEGRSYVTFVYPTARVHELTVRSPVIRAAGMADYQIRQTPAGLDAQVQASGELDVAALAAALRGALIEAGLADPEVTVRSVDFLDRDPLSGKVRRLVPLGSAPGGEVA